MTKKDKNLKRTIIILLLMSLAMVGVFAGISVVRRFYPLRHVEIIKHYSDFHGLDKILVISLIHAESRFEPLAVSPVGARGLMQLMENTANWAAEEMGLENYNWETIFEPEMNIRIGTWYLARLLNQFDNNLHTALAAYNAGSGNVRRWLSDADYSQDGYNLDEIPFGETRRYIRRIEQNLTIYRVLFPIYDFLGN